MTSVSAFLKTHRRIVGRTAIGFIWLALISQSVTKYLLDPDAGVNILTLSICALLTIFIFSKVRSKKTKDTSRDNIVFSTLPIFQKLYTILFVFFFFILTPYGLWLRIFENISRLKTESPFFAPTRESVVKNYNAKEADFNKTIELMKKIRDGEMTIDMQNQVLYKKYYPEIVLNMESLGIPFAAKYPNQIFLSIFKSKRKDIVFLSASKLINDTQKDNCEKIKLDFYLCTFDNP